MIQRPPIDTLRQMLVPQTARTPFIAVAVGSGQLARYAVEAGADLLLVLNAGLYRNLGTGSLAAFMPFGNANDQTEELLVDHVLPRAEHVPVVAGVLASDPTCELDDRLDRLKQLGVAGVTNWPAISFVDGQFREALEEAGWNLDGEIAMLQRARERGLATFGFGLTADDVRRFAESGVEGVILDLGLTRKLDDLQQHRDQLQRAICGLNEMHDAVQSTGRNPLAMAFGGPFTTAEDLEQLFRQSAVNGFAGGSVFERLPVQSSIHSTVCRFKSIAVNSRHRDAITGQGEMIGRTPAMLEVFGLITRFAPHDVNVYVEGESGTGKELVAAQIHQSSRRAGQAFVTLNCGAIPDGLLESELFGHEKGAFTGADRRHLGKFELANRGTLFLDEIADLGPRGQVALLRVLQQREISRVGGEGAIPVDVRIVAASNRPLENLVKQGHFRADLYYRLSHCTIQLPPLRQRLEDLPLLADFVLARLQVQLSRKLDGLSTAFQRKLRQHGWPGNVRELQHVLTQAALREDQAVLEGDHFVPVAASRFDAEPSTHESQRAAALQALRDAHGNKSKAASSLGVSRKTLYAWLRPHV